MFTFFCSRHFSQVFFSKKLFWYFDITRSVPQQFTNRRLKPVAVLFSSEREISKLFLYLPTTEISKNSFKDFAHGCWLKSINQSLFVKRVYFPMFSNILLYTQLACAFYLHRYLDFIHIHVAAFSLFFLPKHLDTFHDPFFKAFCCFFWKYLADDSLNMFIYDKNVKNGKLLLKDGFKLLIVLLLSIY